MPIITVRITKYEHSTLFRCSQSGGTFQDFLTAWKEAKSSILNNAFEGRSAVSVIQLIDEDYFPDTGYVKRSIIEKDAKYLILSSTNWNEYSLTDMINYMEFHLAKQWFIEQKAEDNLQETIQLINDLQFTIENETHLELLGCVNDGKEIIWFNPKLDCQSKVFQSLNVLPNVITIFE